MPHEPANAGLVVLAGAGPAGANLLTAEAATWISRSETVVYDRLVSADVLRLCPADAERIYVGKAPGGARAEQDAINRLLVEKAREGRLVVRLKGGDPLVFGRGGEEAEALSAAGVPFRIVPGVTAGLAAAAYAGVPLTHRRDASAVALVTGHEDADKAGSALDWAALARIDTLVVYMGVAGLAAIAKHLLAAGRAPGTPAVIVERAGSARQRTTSATLATLPAEAAAAGVRPPAVVIIGEVGRLQGRLSWFDRLPLRGRTVVVTRAAGRTDDLAERLAERGAHVICAPAIEIRPPADTSALDAAVRRAGDFDWLLVTSPSGVEAFFARLAAHRLDARALAGVKVAAVGPATADALRRRGISPDLVPHEYTTQALGAALSALASAQRRRILLARADIAPPALAEALRSAGSDVLEVAAYETRCPAALPEEAADALRAGTVDWITFTSSSTVVNFLALTATLDVDPSPVKRAALGPATAETLAAHGLPATVTADPHTIPALVAAIARHAAPEPTR